MATAKTVKALNINKAGFIVRVRSCDFVDRSHLFAKQTIHEAHEMRSEK